MSMLREQGDLGAGRIWQLAQPLLTYIGQNKSAIVDYGARYRSGRRIATALAESAVNSLTARRMVKKQQMRWSKRGAHLMLQVRAAVMNGNLREQLSYEPASVTACFAASSQLLSDSARTSITLSMAIAFSLRQLNRIHLMTDRFLVRTCLDLALSTSRASISVSRGRNLTLGSRDLEAYAIAARPLFVPTRTFGDSAELRETFFN
jgi:hypothetical protein